MWEHNRYLVWDQMQHISTHCRQNAEFCVLNVCFKAVIDHAKDLENWSIYVNPQATKFGKRESIYLTPAPQNSTVTKKSTEFPL
jgi:hypothetical protein